MQEECVGLGASLEAFNEVDEVVGIIKGLGNTIKDENAHELVVERFKYVLDWYQEQPHLLDPHLESLLGVGNKIYSSSLALNNCLNISYDCRGI